MGSTAETIFRSSTVPVLTVGPNCRCHRSEAIVLNTILYATDFSPVSDLALPYAFSIAKEHHAHLVLLHVAKGKMCRSLSIAQWLAPNHWSTLESLSMKESALSVRRRTS